MQPVKDAILRWERIQNKSRRIIAIAVELRNKRQKPAEATVFVWAAKDVVVDDGSTVNDLVALTVPKDIDVQQAKKDLTEKIPPLAVLVVQDLEEGIKARLESIFGAESWDLPMVRKGDRMEVAVPKQ